MRTAANTEADASAWARRYQTALRRYQKTGTAASARAAPPLGRAAVRLGMETLDVARVHKQALATLGAAGGSPAPSPDPADRASRFFAEVIVPIEQTHGPARQADKKVTELTQSLRRRTQEATASSRRLEKGVARRQTAETALQKSVRNRAGLLTEAERLRLQLKQLTAQILSAQEHERDITGQHLRDDTAQMLLAIEFRLLALDGATQTNNANLKKVIAETQHIMKDSLDSIQRNAPATEGHDHET